MSSKTVADLELLARFASILKLDSSEGHLKNELQSISNKFPKGATGKIHLSLTYALKKFKLYYLLAVEIRKSKRKTHYRVTGVRELTLDGFIEIEEKCNDFQKALHSMKDFINPEPPPF